jgi:hypothetical protein
LYDVGESVVSEISEDYVDSLETVGYNIFDTGKLGIDSSYKISVQSRQGFGKYIPPVLNVDLMLQSEDIIRTVSLSRNICNSWSYGLNRRDIRSLLVSYFFQKVLRPQCFTENLSW